MRFWTLYKTRKYFLRILISTFLFITVCLVTFTSILHSYSKYTTMSLQQESINKILTQVNYNVEALNRLVENFTFSFFFQNDATVLMQSNTIDVFTLSNKLRWLNESLISNSFLHSIIIHNANNGCYYSTLEPSLMDCSGERDNILSTLLSKGQSLPKLKLLPGESNEYFSFFMYDALQYQPNQSLLMVNLKSQWLFDNIRSINNLGNDEQSIVLLMDQSGKFITTQEQADVAANIQQAIRQQLMRSASPNGYFILEEQGKQIVTYITSNANNWIIISLQSYDSIFGKMTVMLSVSYIILFVFFLLAVSGSVLISIKLYKPVGNLMNSVSGMSSIKKDSFPRGEDELSYISHVYGELSETVNSLRLKQSKDYDIVKTYYVRSLLTQSPAISAGQFQELIQNHELMICDKGPYAICIFRVDDFSGFVANFSESEQRLIKFAIANIGSELIAELFVNQPAEMKNDHIAFILSVQAVEEQQWLEALKKVCQEIQCNVFNYYHISLTVSVSDLVSIYSRIPEGYEQAFQNSQYRFVLGKGSIIAAAEISIKENDNYHLPADLEQKIMDSLKSNDLPRLEACLTTFFEKASQLEYNRVTYAMLQLMMIFHNVIRELNLSKDELRMIDMNEFNLKVFEQDTLAEVHILFQQLSHRFIELRQRYKENRNDFLIDAINETIRKKYADPNLSLKFIAAMFKISPAYLGKVYRNSESRSVADYINEVRTEQAIRMIDESDDNILTIMQQVGFMNESSFFKWFRKSTGMTPREYRLRKK